MEGEVEKNDGTKESASTDSLLHWSRWKLNDSILPIGGFAHSFGLEAAIQARLISGPEDLQTHVVRVLENKGSLRLPFVYCATISPNIQTWYKVDKTLNATLTNEVSHKASIAQVSTLMRGAASVFYRSPFSQNNERCIFRHWDGLFPPCSHLWG